MVKFDVFFSISKKLDKILLLDEINAVVVDLQDIGTRVYTFYSSYTHSS